MNLVTTRVGMTLLAQAGASNLAFRLVYAPNGYAQPYATIAETVNSMLNAGGVKANLVAEELFLNTVKHGHRGGSDAPVWITVEERGGRISLTYEDRAPPFNPFSRATREMLEALADTRREGGLGVLLAHGLTASAEYAYVFGRNRIRLTLA